MGYEIINSEFNSGQLEFLNFEDPAIGNATLGDNFADLLNPDTGFYDIGIGISSNFNNNGVFYTSYTTQQQAISNLKFLLLTAKGERIFQPEFGTDLILSLFEPIVDATINYIKSDIVSAINYWLPYIVVNDITVNTYETDPSLNYDISVAITFSAHAGPNSETTIQIFALNNGQLVVTDSTVPAGTSDNLSFL